MSLERSSTTREDTTNFTLKTKLRGSKDLAGRTLTNGYTLREQYTKFAYASNFNLFGDAFLDRQATTYDGRGEHVGYIKLHGDTAYIEYMRINVPQSLTLKQAAQILARLDQVLQDEFINKNVPLLVEGSTINDEIQDESRADAICDVST